MPRLPIPTKGAPGRHWGLHTPIHTPNDAPGLCPYVPHCSAFLGLPVACSLLTGTQHAHPPPGPLHTQLHPSAWNAPLRPAFPWPFPLLVTAGVPSSSPGRTHSSIHPSIHPSIHSSIHPSVRPSIHPSIRPSIHPSIRPSVHQAQLSHRGPEPLPWRMGESAGHGAAVLKGGQGRPRRGCLCA